MSGIFIQYCYYNAYEIGNFAKSLFLRDAVFVCYNLQQHHTSKHEIGKEVLTKITF